MEMFDSYVRMIRKVAWKVAKKRGVDFSDVEAQGFLVYCMTLKAYDVSKAGFGTYLYIQLNGRLNDYADSVKRVECNEDGVFYDSETSVVDSFLEGVESKDYEIKNDFLDEAYSFLDKESYEVFEYLVSFEWLVNRQKPSIADVMRKFGYKRDYAKKLWNNCRNFWRNVA